MFNYIRSGCMLFCFILFFAYTCPAQNPVYGNSDANVNAMVNDPKNVEAASSDVIPGSKKASSPYFKISKDKIDGTVAKPKKAFSIKKPVQSEKNSDIDKPVNPVNTKSADKPLVSMGDDPDVSVIEAEICERIVAHKPVGVGDKFSSETKTLTCFTKIKSSQEIGMKHIWYFNGKQSLEVPLKISASTGGWRAFSAKTMTPSCKGEWKVDIVTSNGTLIKSLPFTIN